MRIQCAGRKRHPCASRTWHERLRRAIRARLRTGSCSGDNSPCSRTKFSLISGRNSRCSGSGIVSRPVPTNACDERMAPPFRHDRDDAPPIRQSKLRDRGPQRRRRWGALLQRLGRNDAGGESDRGGVGQIHAAQFVAGPIQMRFHAAKRQTKDFRDLLIGLSARRPKQTLLFPDRQLDRERTAI